jgi:hypothetical protein
MDLERVIEEGRRVDRVQVIPPDELASKTMWSVKKGMFAAERRYCGLSVGSGRGGRCPVLGPLPCSSQPRGLFVGQSRHEARHATQSYRATDASTLSKKVRPILAPLPFPVVVPLPAAEGCRPVSPSVVPPSSSVASCSPSIRDVTPPQRHSACCFSDAESTLSLSWSHEDSFLDFSGLEWPEVDFGQSDGDVHLVASKDAESSQFLLPPPQYLSNDSSASSSIVVIRSPEDSDVELVPRSPKQLCLDLSAVGLISPPSEFADPSAETLDALPGIVQTLMQLMKTFPNENVQSIAERLASMTVHVNERESLLLASAAIAAQQSLAASLVTTLRAAMMMDPSGREACREAELQLNAVLKRLI